MRKIKIKLKTIPDKSMQKKLITKLRLDKDYAVIIIRGVYYWFMSSLSLKLRVSL